MPCNGRHWPDRVEDWRAGSQETSGLWRLFGSRDLDRLMSISVAVVGQKVLEELSCVDRPQRR